MTHPLNMPHVAGVRKARGANKRVDQHTCTACTRRVHEGEKAVQGCSDCYWLEWGDAPTQAREESLATAKDRPARPSTARCPVCHRMAPVKQGCFQPHPSGSSTCAGSADLAGAAEHALRSLGWPGVGDPIEWAQAQRDKTDIPTVGRMRQLEADLEVLGAEATRLTERRDALHTERRAMLERLGWRTGMDPEAVLSKAADAMQQVQEARERAYSAEGKMLRMLERLGWREGMDDEGVISQATFSMQQMEDIKREFAAHQRLRVEGASVARQVHDLLELLDRAEPGEGGALRAIADKLAADLDASQAKLDASAARHRERMDADARVTA